MACSLFCMKTKTDSAPPPSSTPPQWLEVVRASVEEMRFGSVQVVVHDGRVTQVEATRRTRLVGDAAPPR